MKNSPSPGNVPAITCFTFTHRVPQWSPPKQPARLQCKSPEISAAPARPAGCTVTKAQHHLKIGLRLGAYIEIVNTSFFNTIIFVIKLKGFI
jgi:hypothetical protein